MRVVAVGRMWSDHLTQKENLLGGEKSFLMKTSALCIKGGSNARDLIIRLGWHLPDY